MVGSTLRAAREAKGLTLDEVETATRIRVKYLEALEADDLAAIPSVAQARGFLRNYAQFLGLDAHDIITRMPDGGNRPPQSAVVSKPRVAATGQPPAPRPSRPPIARPVGEVVEVPESVVPISPFRAWVRRTFTPDLFIGLIVMGLLIALLTWGATWVANNVALAPTPITTASIITGLTPTLVTTRLTTPTPEGVETTTEPLPTSRTDYTGVVNLVVRANQRLWLRIAVDGTETFVGQLRPGETREFEGRQFVELATGNAGGLRVIWNGQDQGDLGDFGEVLARTWTQGGMVFPTVTPTPSP